LVGGTVVDGAYPRWRCCGLPGRSVPCAMPAGVEGASEAGSAPGWFAIGRRCPDGYVPEPIASLSRRSTVQFRIWGLVGIMRFAEAVGRVPEAEKLRNEPGGDMRRRKEGRK